MKAALLSLVIATLAGAARAEALAADVLAQAILAKPQPRLASTIPDLSRPGGPSRFASALPPGIARTSIDHKFDDDGGAASFGYLCGRDPGQKMSGVAGATGYDPMGKFLGAKLSLAFH